MHLEKDLRMRILRTLTIGLLALICLTGSLSAEIEKPVKGKRYKLAKNHGPWMIMVAAIRDVDDEDRRVEGGMTAWEAADAIVFALRQEGIPAYTFSQDEKVAEISSPSANENNGRRYVAQHGYISVMAGNFPSSDDPKAKEAIEFIKKGFSPSFLKDPKSGGILPQTPGRPSAFSRAFMTVNPLYEGTVRDAAEDDMLVELNSGQKYSLLQNKGKYSLVVATFRGSSVMQVGNEKSSKAMGFFEKNFGTNLNECAENAAMLTEKMRNAKKYGYESNFEAWVLHGKYQSMVLVGSFDSKDDPQIRILATKFGGKMIRHPQTGDDVLAGEVFTVPKTPKANRLPDYSWLFDVKPHVIEVPGIR
jgi:hypothetical protein